jgi:hypothetical protein
MNHIKQIIKSIIIGSFCNVVLAEKSTLDSVSWKQFIRGGLVQVSKDNGISGYYRLNRTSKYSFGDLRLYHYSLNNNSYIFIRYKNSSKYRGYSRLYRFSTIAYQKNKKAGVALRYHFNQGLGYFLIPYNKGHIITELAHAYDMSDYLNDNRKTSYARSGIYWDHDTKFFSSKLEFEYFHQISEVVEENLSRTQIMSEIIIPLKNKISASLIYETENYKQLNNNANSISFSIGWRGNVKWKF